MRAGKRDSVDSIARRYRVSPSQVAQWNDVGTGAQFAPGQTVVVYVATKGQRGTAPATSTRFAATVHGTRVAHSAHRAGTAAAGGAGRSARGTHKHVRVAKN